MPLSIDVGLSRKASKDFQSTGVTINITAELDQALLARPGELQQQIGALYARAEAALERQAQTMGEPDAAQRRPEHRQDDGHPAPSGGRTNGSGDRGYADRRRASGNGSAATDSQRRAIAAIARRMGIDPALEARDIIGAELDDLTLRQASELIDHLKGLQPASGRNGDPPGARPHLT